MLISFSSFVRHKRTFDYYWDRLQQKADDLA